MTESKAALCATQRLLAEALRAGKAWSRWSMERRELTRWQRLRTRLRRLVGLRPLACDEEWVLRAQPIPSGAVLRFRRRTPAGGDQ